MLSIITAFSLEIDGLNNQVLYGLEEKNRLAVSWIKNYPNNIASLMEIEDATLITGITNKGTSQITHVGPGVAIEFINLSTDIKSTQMLYGDPDKIIDSIENYLNQLNQIAENKTISHINKKGVSAMVKYRFLEYVVDSKKLKSEGSSDLKGMDSNVRTAVITITEDSLNNKLEGIYFELDLDSKEIIKDYMNYDEELSNKVSDDFDSTYGSGGWDRWREDWIKKQGWKINIMGVGNTYNWGTFIGNIFEYTDFITDDDLHGVIIMWHQGGDIRGNYSVPEIWIGDFESFTAIQDIQDIEEEMAYRLGYDGNWTNLEQDIHNWWFETGEESTTIQEDYEDVGQMRLPMESSNKSGKNVVESDEDLFEEVTNEIVEEYTEGSEEFPEGKKTYSWELDMGYVEDYLKNNTDWKENKVKRYLKWLGGKTAGDNNKESSKKIALELWTSPKNYMGEDFFDYYKGPAQSRDSDNSEKSNFETALKMLDEENSPDVIVSHSAHWSGGWVEQILVHKDAIDKVKILEEIMDSLGKYLLLDEDVYRMMESADQVEAYGEWAADEAMDILGITKEDIEANSEIERYLQEAVFATFGYYGELTLSDGKQLKKEFDPYRKELTSVPYKELEDKGQIPLLMESSNKNTLEDWYVIGLISDSGEDRLWNFEDPSGLLQISPPYIQGEKGFIDGMLDLYGEDFGKTLALNIIESNEKEIIGEEKERILKEIDNYYKESTEIDTNYFNNKNKYIVYQLVQMDKRASVDKSSGDISYFSWIKKNYPEKYEYFNSIPVGQKGRYYSESQEFVRQKLDEITGVTINSSGNGYAFCYIDYYGSSRNKCFEKPDALIAYVNKIKNKTSMNKESKTNEDVIEMFLKDSFPKDKMSEWGTDNLKISKRSDGWSLVNYSTPLLYRANGELTVYFNIKKYSVSTSKIQYQIRKLAKQLGIGLEEVDESGIFSKGASKIKAEDKGDKVEDPINYLENEFSIDIGIATLVKEFLDDVKFSVDDVTAIKEDSGGWDGLIGIDIGKNEDYYLFGDENTARNIAIELEKQTLESEGPIMMLGDNWKQWLDGEKLRNDTESDASNMLYEDIKEGAFDDELIDEWDDSNKKSELEIKISEMESQLKDGTLSEDEVDRLNIELESLQEELDNGRDDYLEKIKDDPDSWGEFEKYKEQRLDELMNNIGDYIDEKTLLGYFDLDKAVEDIVDSDGVSSILGSYDGTEHNLKSGGVWFRHN